MIRWPAFILCAATTVGCASSGGGDSPLPSHAPPSFVQAAFVTGPYEEAIVDDGKFATFRWVNAAKVFNWHPDKVIQISVACCGGFTMIHLGKGERHTGDKVSTFSDPDGTRWMVTGAVAGDTEIVTIGAKSAGQKASMLITTNARAYQFEVTSVSAAKDDNIVKFKFVDVAAEAKKKKVKTFDRNQIDNLYTIELIDGTEPQWMPKSVFRIPGERKTWIEFQDSPGRIGAPTVFIQYADMDYLIPATIRTDGPFYEIDAEFSAAELKLGSSSVRIERKAS